MNARLLTTVILAALVGVGAAGCGSSAPAAPPAANVSVSVPVNGAVVFVPHVRLEGTVAAGVHRIRVAGHRVRVHRGGFSVAVRLRRGRNRITILAAAPGLVATRSSVTVRYRPTDLNSGPSLADLVNGACMNLENRDFVLAVSTPQAKARTRWEKVGVMLDREVARFRTFSAPPNERAAYSSFLTLQAQAAAEFHALLRATSVATVRQGLTALLAVVKRRDKVGYALGFSECVSLLGELKQINS